MRKIVEYHSNLPLYLFKSVVLLCPSLFQGLLLFVLLRLLVFGVDLDVTATLFDELVVAVVAFGGETKEFVEIVVGCADIAVSYGLKAVYFQSGLRVVVLLLGLYAETAVF